MTVHDLYLESGPKHRTTMVHMFGLLGCIAIGPTTEEALAATPDAIRSYLRFLHRHGEETGASGPIETRVVEHITEGEWLGNGSPYIVFPPDFEPVSDEDLAMLLRRFRWLREDLAAWLRTQSAELLDVPPQPRGRTARAIVLHLLATPGSYLGAALGGAKGFSHLQTEAERGLIPLDVALLRVAELVEERIAESTPEERLRVIERPKDTRTFRKALRRMLEHDWEHARELARRPGGPDL